MTATVPADVDPESRTRAQWVGLVANRKARGAADDDPDVQAARSALAYYRIAQGLAAEAGHLSAPGIDRLVSRLREQGAAEQ